MDISPVQCRKYWEPNYLQTISLSIVSGSVATLVTHPLEFLKTVVQFKTEGTKTYGESGNSSINSVSKIKSNTWSVCQGIINTKFRKEGVMQLYRGLQNNMMAKLSYLTIRNLTYSISYDFLDSNESTGEFTNGQKVLLAGFSGGFAAYVTSPFSMITIREILDS